MNDLANRVAELLNSSQDRQAALRQVLHLVLAELCSETATVHRLDPKTQQLHLEAETGLPPAMLEVVRTIPVGKGIAGQTAARGEPVSICNLQKDTSGVARPGARQTGVGGAICVPVRSGEAVVGTLGIGTLRQHEYTAEETRTLEEVGLVIGRFLDQS